MCVGEAAAPAELKRVSTKDVVLVIPKIQVFPRLDVAIRKSNTRSQIVAAGGLLLRLELQPALLGIRRESDDLGEVTARGDVARVLWNAGVPH